MEICFSCCFIHNCMGYFCSKYGRAQVALTRLWVGVTNRYDKSLVPTFLLETYFAQITGIEKEGFMKYTPGIKGSKTATQQTKTRHQFVTSVNLLKGQTFI